MIRDSFTPKIDTVINNTDLATKNSLLDLGDKIGELSKKRVPVLTGFLKSSFEKAPKPGGYFVGYNTTYASKQHVTNKKSPEFLALPVKNNSKLLLDFFKERYYINLKKAL